MHPTTRGYYFGVYVPNPLATKKPIKKLTEEEQRVEDWRFRQKFYITRESTCGDVY